MNLEDNKLGDSSTIILLQVLQSNRSLKRLNLSKNLLTNKISEAMKELIQKNTYLQEIYLHWNQIKSKGGNDIFEGKN